jgi:hypothetical protein
MRCLACQYDLSHLTGQRCPECGRALDLNDPSTFDDGRRSSPWPRRLCILIALSALLLPLMWYSTWLAAVISLGHLPRPYEDDPKFINGWVRGFRNLTWMMFMFSLPLFMLNLMLAVMAGVQQYISDRRWSVGIVIPIGLTLALWVSAVFLIRASGPTVACWFFD